MFVRVKIIFSDSVSSYLISEGLERYLLGKISLKNNKSFFVVVFNTITKGDSKVLIYNYMEYNINFIELFYAYLLLEFKLSRSSLSGGNDNFCLVDKDLYSRYGLDKYKVCKDFKLYEIKLNIINFLQDVIENYQGILHEDLDKMGEIVFNLVNKDYKSLVENLNGGDVDDSKLESIDEYENIEFNNLLPKFIFVVSDLNSLIEVIKRNFMKDVNQGPQKYRGRVNSLSHSLFLLNKNFIDRIAPYRILYKI